MFTGIVAALGTVESLTPTAHGSARLTITAGEILSGLGEGGSLAVNGVCLTALDADSAADSRFRADAMGETLARTGIGALSPGDTVNLERCPAAGDRFDGHIVQGHVDGTGEILALDDQGDWTRMRVSVPARLAPLTAEKGSIALDGVSLTLTAVSPADADEHWVEVGLIPATLRATRFGRAQTGDVVNIEVDVIARYAARLAQFSEPAAAPADGAAEEGHRA